MIGRLRGSVDQKSPGAVLVDVGGVGYEVMVSLQAFSRLPAEGQTVQLEIVSQLREDALVLYGFLDEAEKVMFGWLRGVNGVGPKLSLNILSGIPAIELQGALAEGDVARLQRIPGVGKKTAERLVLELRERANQAPQLGTRLDGSPGGSGLESDPTQGRQRLARDREAISALVNLGYRQKDAEQVVAELAPELSLEEAIREALRRFAR